MLAALALAKDIPVVHSYGLLLATFVIASCYHALCAHFVRAKGNTALFAVQGLFNDRRKRDHDRVPRLEGAAVAVFAV